MSQQLPVLLKTLEIEPEFWNFHMNRGAAAARKGLPIVKKVAKSNYRRLAKEHHPDKGGDAEKFRQVQEAWEIVRNLKVVEEPPMQQVETHFAFFGINVNSSTTSSTTMWTSYYS